MRFDELTDEVIALLKENLPSELENANVPEMAAIAFQQCGSDFDRWIARSDRLGAIFSVGRPVLESQLDLSLFRRTMLEDPELHMFSFLLTKFDPQSAKYHSFTIDRMWKESFRQANPFALKMLSKSAIPFPREDENWSCPLLGRSLITSKSKCPNIGRVLACLDWTMKMHRRDPIAFAGFGPTLNRTENTSVILRTASKEVVEWYRHHVQIDQWTLSESDIEKMMDKVPSHRLSIFLPYLTERFPQLVQDNLFCFLSKALGHGRFDVIHLLPLDQLTVKQLRRFSTTYPSLLEGLDLLSRFTVSFSDLV